MSKKEGSSSTSTRGAGGERTETATGDVIMLTSSSSRGRGRTEGGRAEGGEASGGRTRSFEGSRARSRSQNATRRGAVDASVSANLNKRTGRKERRRSSSMSDKSNQGRRQRAVIPLLAGGGPPLRTAKTISNPYGARLDDSLQDESLTDDKNLTKRTSGTMTEEMKQRAANSSFSNMGKHTASFGHDDHSNANNDMDDSGFDLDNPIPHASTLVDKKEKPGLVNLSSLSNIFARRGDLRDVDQSVNLMDVETGKYETKKTSSAQQKPGRGVKEVLFGSGTRQSSLKDINLGPDPTNRRAAHFYLQQKARKFNNNPWRLFTSTVSKCCKPILRTVCSAPFLAAILIIGLLVCIPYLQDKVNSLPAPTAVVETPEPTPRPTPSATPAPTKELVFFMPASVPSRLATPKPAPTKVPDSTNSEKPFTPPPGEDFLAATSREFTDPVKKQDEEFISAITQRYNVTLALILSSGVSSLEDLNTTNSPQHNALMWLLASPQQNFDEAPTKGVRRRLVSEDVHTVERYTAAVLFFAMVHAGGNNETKAGIGEFLSFNAAGLTPDEMALLAYAVSGNMTSQEEKVALFFYQMQVQGFNGTTEEFLHDFHLQMSLMAALNMTPSEELYLLSYHPGGGHNNITEEELTALYHQLQLMMWGPNTTSLGMSFFNMTPAEQSMMQQMGAFSNSTYPGITYNMTPDELHMMQQMMRNPNMTVSFNMTPQELHMMQQMMANGTHDGMTLEELEEVMEAAMMGNGTHNMTPSEMQIFQQMMNATMMQQQIMGSSGHPNMTLQDMQLLLTLANSSTNLTPEELQVLHMAASHNATAEELVGLFFNPMMPDKFAELDDNSGPPPPAPAVPQTISLSTGSSQNQNVRRHLGSTGFMEFWMTGNHICQWQGIKCDSNSHVTKLNLTDSKLRGTIPSEIQGFHVRSLCFKACFLWTSSRNCN